MFGSVEIQKFMCFIPGMPSWRFDRELIESLRRVSIFSSVGSWIKSRCLCIKHEMYYARPLWVMNIWCWIFIKCQMLNRIMIHVVTVIWFWKSRNMTQTLISDQNQWTIRTSLNNSAILRQPMRVRDQIGYINILWSVIVHILWDIKDTKTAIYISNTIWRWGYWMNVIKHYKVDK